MMNDKELLQIWKSYDQKMNETLKLNKDIAYKLTREKLNKTINTLAFPKSSLLLLGIPYALILCFLSWLTYKSEAYIMMFGFGMIGLIMIATIIGYTYQLYLISKINRLEEVTEVQKRIAQLKISSYNIARLAVIQLPFWSICWISIAALRHSPMIYGGINLSIFLGLSYLSYWLYKDLNINNNHSGISKLIFSGSEWEPIMKSADLLEQLKEYEK